MKLVVKRIDGTWEFKGDWDDLQKYEIALIDWITFDTERRGLNSIADHPEYPELEALQEFLYPEKGGTDAREKEIPYWKQRENKHHQTEILSKTQKAT